MTRRVRLDFYGVAVELSGDAAVLAELARDFSYFRALPTALDPISLEVRVGRPFAGRPEGQLRLKTKRYRAYDDGPVRRIDYAGRALAEYDYVQRAGAIMAENETLARELAYLAVLSRVGEALDLRGLHRVHALGLEWDGQGVLLLLPSGGGKSTLAREALRREGVGRLLSDDSPLVDDRGVAHPFPLCLGLRGPARDVPPALQRVFRRRDYSDKWLVDVEFFRSGIASRSAVRLLLLGRRAGASQPSIRPAGPRAALSALAAHMVVGVGLAQMTEYVIRPEARHAGRWLKIAALRAMTAARLALRVPAYRFELGPDPSCNWEALQSFLSGGAAAAP